jgi:phospholipid/cholesterol/gamma-HCH transport system substrate-binding protein
VKTKLSGAIWRFGVFALVCLLAAFALVAIFGQIRFGESRGYRAQFSNVSGLARGNFVRIAGVEVGKVTDIEVGRDATVTVGFTTDPSVVLTSGTKAIIRYDNLIGGRSLALEQGAGSTTILRPGGTIPLGQTSPALDLDALVGGFRPLFRALNPEQVNAFTAQLITVFQGQGATIGSLLAHTAELTNTLADRDQLIGEVITNLNTVLGSLSDRSDQLDRAVTSLSEFVRTLSERRSDISAGVANINEAGKTVADLLEASRPPAKDVVAQTDRVSATVLSDHEYFDDLLARLPDAYKLIGRQGLYGDYFSYYLCDVLLKVNGKGGQPVYIKVVSQTTGRCTPK